jgi:hypothetical protein
MRSDAGPWVCSWKVHKAGWNARLGLAPKLNFRLIRLLKTRTPIEVTVQYYNWSGGLDGERAIQATLRSDF